MGGANFGAKPLAECEIQVRDHDGSSSFDKSEEKL
jgi:hypothetical protein